jgi:hypothetical protein
MKKQVWIGSVLAASLSVLGCNKGANVEKEVEDLREAQQNSPNVEKQLQDQLANAKSEVVRLEEKAALAKQGVTDEVVEERQELKEALKKQENEVREEVKEAQGAAAAHNQDSQKAVQHLEKSQPTQRVEARVKTETTSVPTGSKVEVTREQQQIPIENSKLTDQAANQGTQAATTTTSTTTTQGTTGTAGATGNERKQ